MAHYFAAKAPTEVVERRWTVPVDCDDGAESVVLVDTDVTVDSDSFEGNELVLVLSGGSEATVGTITATVTTSQGRVLVETLYIPVITSAIQSRTVQDIVSFALRKVFGIGRTPPAKSAADALERLNDMLATWAMQGAAIGTTLPLELTDALTCPDWAVTAVKHNLILEVCDIYGREPGQRDIDNARRGLQQIKQSNLPDDRTGAEYY